MHTSGISQAIMLKLLKHWGPEGFKAHVRFVQLFYKRRRDASIAAAERHLKDIAEWGVPEAGEEWMQSEIQSGSYVDYTVGHTYTHSSSFQSANPPP